MNEKEKEKDGFIKVVATRYGFREGQRIKKSELLRAQRNNGLDDIKQLGKQVNYPSFTEGACTVRSRGDWLTRGHINAKSAEVRREKYMHTCGCSASSQHL